LTRKIAVVITVIAMIKCYNIEALDIILLSVTKKSLLSLYNNNVATIVIITLIVFKLIRSNRKLRSIRK